MTLTSEQLEQLKVERLQKEIEGRPIPFFSAGNTTANQSIDDDFVQRKVEVPKPSTEPQQQQRVDNNDAAEAELTPEMQEEQLIAQAIKNIAAEDRAALAFVQRHKSDYHATPANGEKIFTFLNDM